MPAPQYVASKKVAGVAPVPPQASGSSAPLSVEATSTGKTLIARSFSSNGVVPSSASANRCASPANCPSSDSR